MKMTEVLFGLLRSALTGETLERIPELTEPELQKLYRLSNRYDLAHLVGYALNRAGRLPDSAAGIAFRKKQMEALWRTEQQEYERERMGAVLEKVGIPHIFLKGAVLRKLYPEPWMRTGSDIDLLVREEEHEQTLQILCEELGYRCGLRTPDDASLVFSSGQHVEVHLRLSATASAEQLLSRVWEGSRPAEGKRCERVLTEEWFYVYHVLHMAKHFEQGGCGIRPFADLWILKEKMPWDEAAAKELLRTAGGLTFAETAWHLTEMWFSGAEPTSLAKRMEDYTLSGGVYGSVTKKVAVGQIKTGGKTRNFMSRVFLPYQIMAGMYPPLRSHPWRLPYYEMCRWCRLLFQGSARSVWAELRENHTVSKQEISTTKRLLKDLELL